MNGPTLAVEPHLMAKGRMRRGSPSQDEWMATELREHGMLTEEIEAIFETRDPDIVHRYMELHAERLTERLAEQCRMLSLIEHFLVSRDAWRAMSSDHGIALVGGRC